MTVAVPLALAIGRGGWRRQKVRRGEEVVVPEEAPAEEAPAEEPAEEPADEAPADDETSA